MSRYITGFHAIEESLKTARGASGGAEALWIAGNPGPRVKKLVELAGQLGVRVQKSDDRELARLSGSQDHRGVVLQAREAAGDQPLVFEDVLSELSLEAARIGELPETNRVAAKWPCILILDSITDPHNLGAILRSADKFGVDLVVLPQRRSAQENETVRKSSAGAAAWVRSTVVGNLNRAVEQCREAGFWVCGADMNGTPVHRFDARRPLAVVMGSEGKGIARLLGERCDEMLSIPCTGHVDSLNVSVAAAVLLYEIRRQQGFSW
jgi:23S rRNA (guanosine2251-2'-O)-methyltransferase